jgi:hypothetical protein
MPIEVSGTDHTYPYQNFIKMPDQLGSSSKANALGPNVKALSAYVNTLVSGNSKAQTVAGPLGNKYFMDTGGTCTDASGVNQTRHVFINNIPDGSIPFISSAMGEKLTSFEGLVPGVLGSLSYMNPTKIFSAFEPTTPCQKIKMPIRDITNATSEESKYVCESDIADYNPCWFSSGKNPITKTSCKNGMTTQFPKDQVVNIYVTGIYCLGAYLLYCLVSKKLK